MNSINEICSKNKEGINAHARIVFSFAAIFIFLILATASIFINPFIARTNLRNGDVALRDVYAPYDFFYTWGKNEKKTAEVIDKAVENVPYFFKRDTQLEEKIYRKFEIFFNALSKQNYLSVDNIALNTPEDNSGFPKVAEFEPLRLINSFGLNIDNYEYMSLRHSTEILKDAVFSTLSKLFTDGIIDETSRKLLNEEKDDYVVIFSDMETTAPRLSESLIDFSLVDEKIKMHVKEYFEEEDEEFINAIAGFIQSGVSSNVIADKERTSEEEKKIIDNIEPIYNVWEVKKNELILQKGSRINERHLAEIYEITELVKRGKTKNFLEGMLLLFVLLGMVLWIYMAFTYKVNVLNNTRDIVIILTNIFFVLLVADIIIQTPLPSYSIPFAGSGMIIMLLLGFGPAFVVSVIMGILVAVLIGGTVSLVIVFLSGAVVGIYALRNARRRADILWAGIFAGLIQFLAVITVGLINDINFAVYFSDAFWGFLGGVSSAAIVMAGLPLFEYIFKIPTNISLVELSDLNHPLLKRLAMEAPGTYHHSIMVGNLAEAASDSIGANSLLVRVGAYYHDIGKINKPQYYSENEMGEGSKHAGLTPSMSALIIGKHVKDGVDIAQKYKLNTTIIDFIKQHHGDSLISYFYQKAKEEAKEDLIPDEETFRYMGPRPQIKETAIVLLADSIEASSRTLIEPSVANVRNLVKKIINNKLIDGQLDSCDLTLKEIDKISESFIKVLMAIFHTRATYPDESKKAETQKTENNGKNKFRKFK
ncbi:domain HDIG-containing protein [Candidatus Omnitrophus magneticus]|uniref:Domain HDIG-containing protein n=1 Tax=Candidatus Omnitrophus magneticus TaxID=1609969 RepID=A0A0F0CT79_9BACT|nr:domain HDIG-containing protein [Candidatus Omnitrophus magneticus]